MSSYNRRYAILQDKSLKSSEVESVKSVTTPPTVTGVNQSTKFDMYGEGSLEPSVELTSSASKGDLSITATGAVLPTYDEDTNNAGTYAYNKGISPRETSGSGIIQTDGASGRSRYAFIKEGQSDYQFRTTPNYFGKVPFTLNYDEKFTYSGKAECFTRPKLLSLANGNLLCAYLDSYSPPWMWSFSSNLLDPDLGVSLYSFSVASYNSGTQEVTITGSPGWNSAIQVNRYFTQNPSASDPTYARIIATDQASLTFTIEDKGMSVSTGLSYIYTVERFRNRPSNTSASNVKLRLSMSEDKFWSDENTSFPLSNSADFGATGLGLVEFPDTNEVLLLSCGYLGDATDSLNNSSYLNVDEIRSDFDSYSGFSSGLTGSLVERRSSLGLNTYDGFLANDTTTDIAGLETTYIPLAMTSEVLPSGRLVVVIAFNDKLVSLVSDDRGVSFSASDILDLRFGSDYELQQFCSLDSVISPEGSMVILLTANSLGDRGQSSATPSDTDPIAESVISIFTTTNGTSWSSEKRLGGGSYYLQYSQIAGTTGTTPYPANISKHLDESIYALSGSVCLTPEGGFLVSVCTLNIGGVGNAQGCHVYQRVLSVDEIAFGATGLEIAPSLPAQIYSAAQPVEASISRLSMAIPYFGGARDNDYDTMPALKDYFEYSFRTIGESTPGAGDGSAPSYRATAPHDRGYLGAIYFAGIRFPANESLVYKRLGGGPVLVNGPIDLGTCLHNGEIVTVVCEGWENRTSDSPNSEPYLKSRNATKATLLRGVHVVFSDAFQPLRVNLPTEIRRFDASYTVAGKLNTEIFNDSIPTKSNGRGQIFWDGGDYGTTQDYVQNTHLTCSTDTNYGLIDLTTQDWSGPPYRVISFVYQRGIHADFPMAGLKFSVTSVNYSPGDPTIRLNITGIDGATTDLIFDGYYFELLAQEEVSNETFLDTGMIFGANNYQVSLMGAKNPQYWGWQRSASAGVDGALEEDSESGISYANKWELDTAVGEHLNYSFDKDYNQGEVYGLYTFPNADGELLKSTYPADRDALSFVQRSVVQVQFGGNRRSSDVPSFGSTPDLGLRLSSQVFLRDANPDRASGNFLSLGVGISRVSNTVYLRMIEIYWNGSNTTYQPFGDELSFVDEGTGSDVDEKVPYYEIIWGVEPQGSIDTYKVFMLARPWNRYSDPSFMNDFESIGPVSVISRDDDLDGNDVATSTAAEFVSYGVFDAVNPAYVATKASFQSVQFSRSFLKDEPCMAARYRTQALPLEPEVLPLGLFEFREELHLPKEPAFDFLRFYNGGQMSPMSPARCSSFPQLVDNGIELSFRGRVSSENTFDYKGVSRFPALAALESPVKEGWRSPTEKLTFAVEAVDGADLETSRVPSYEIIYDAGSDSINPESVSFFGINTGSIIVDFNDSPTFGVYGSVSQPRLTMLFCSPGHPNSLLFNYWANSIAQQNNPPASPETGDTYLVGSTPTGDWVGHAGELAVWSGSAWSFSAYFPDTADTVRNKTPGADLDIYDGASWVEYYAEVPRLFYKPTYLMYFQSEDIRYGRSDTRPDSEIRWFINPSVPDTVVFKTNLSVSDQKPYYAPFRPGQFKSQSNENFYLMVVDKEAGGVPFQPTALRSSSDVKYCYYYKIEDNGTDYLKLDRSITDVFRDDITEADDDGRLVPGSMTIISDRVAANMPDFFEQFGGSTASRGERYRYMRITLSGGDHSDHFLKLGMCICGQRLDLSNPDFSVGYSYNLESGSSIFDSLSGRRKSRRNHKPRKSWSVSYEPRPSAPLDIVSNSQNTSVMNSRRGYGNVDDHRVNPAQAQEVQRLSWQELVERVLSIGINGDVLALGFDGNNMQTLSGTTVNLTPRKTDSVADLRPSLSDPHGLAAARLVGYEGATNMAFTAQTIIQNSQGGDGSQSGVPSQTINQTGCTPAAVMQIKGLTFSEEL